jgi:hypothetical protein
MLARRALPRRIALALGLTLALAAPARGLDDGPLGVGTPGAFRALFLEMPLQDARPAPARGRLDVRWWLANEWSVPTALTDGSRLVMVRQDAQTDVLQLSLTLPWARLAPGRGLDRWQTTAELRLLERWGGWTDGIISSWHHLIGSTNFSRSHYPAYKVNLQLEADRGGSLASLHHPGLTLSDLALRTQGTLLAGAAPAGGRAPWAVALRADLKLPTGRVEALGGSGGVDAGLGLAATWAPEPWLTLHALGDVRLVSPLPRRFPLQPRTVQWGLDLSAVVRLRDTVALVAETRLVSPLFRGGWSLLPDEPDPQATAYYGLFRPYNQLSGGVRFSDVTIYFSEDFTPGRRLSTDSGPPWFYNSNAPDIVFGVAWARAL